VKTGQHVQEQAARDLRTYERSLLFCCAGSEVYTHQRACIIKYEAIPKLGRLSGYFDSFDLIHRIAVCSG
jgi:hypothetical protein